jgi:hypothetical protein
MGTELFLILIFGYYLTNNYLNPLVWFYRNIFNSLGFRVLILSLFVIVKCTICKINICNNTLRHHNLNYF